MLIKSAFPFVYSVTIGIRALLAYDIRVNVSNMISEIFWIFERTVTIGFWARESLGLVKVVDIFDMFCKVVFPSAILITAGNGAMVLWRTVGMLFMSI